MTPDIQRLFIETKTAFEKSSIKNFAVANNLNWHYAISPTRLTTGNNVIVGFNWGAADNCAYKPQTQIPAKSFKELYDQKELGSFQRLYLPLKEFFPHEDIDNCLQTNFCFFRSKEENQITPAYLALSTLLFQKLLDIVKPKRIIRFSNKLRDYFLDNKLCSQLESLNIPSNGKTLFVVKGFYCVNGQNIPVFFLPHPNAQFTTEARQAAWDFCFRNNNGKPISPASTERKTISPENSIKQSNSANNEREIFSGSPSQVINFWTFISCIFILPIPLAFWNWLQVRHTHLILTNQRIIMSGGVFSRLTLEIELYRVRDVAVEEPFLYRLFGLGHVVVYSTDKTTSMVRLMAFKNPHWLKEQIRQWAEHYRQNRKWGTIS